jgi:zinc transport system ATP-binding protein
MTDIALRTEHLGVALGGNRVLTDVSVDVGQGEGVAVLGANGSGKSTLIRSALGVVPSDRGQVHILGAPLGPLTPWHRIGYVPQRAPDASAVPTSVEEVVRSGGLAGRRPRRANRTAVTDAMEALGVQDLAHRAFARLSGGQQQRVLVARALVRRPDLLIMDEPTTGMDLASIEALIAALAVHRATGGTLVVVLHGIGAFSSVLDRSIVLDAGHVVTDPSPEELPHHPAAKTVDAGWGLRNDRSIT